MKHIVWRAFWDFEKEEKYLNKMSSEGLAMTDYSWCRYVFEEKPRGEWIYRIELLENYPTHPESQNYIRFMEETGAEFVASYLRWVYFRRKASEGEFSIYSDSASRIQHYKRVRMWFLLVAWINLFAGIMNMVSAFAGRFSDINFALGLVSLTIFALISFSLIIPLTKKIHILRKEKKITE
jgi:hypothetical protein